MSPDRAPFRCKKDLKSEVQVPTVTVKKLNRMGSLEYVAATT